MMVHLTSINKGDINHIMLMHIQFHALQRVALVIFLHISNPQLKQHARLTPAFPNSSQNDPGQTFSIATCYMKYCPITEEK